MNIILNTDSPLIREVLEDCTSSMLCDCVPPHWARNRWW